MRKPWRTGLFCLLAFSLFWQGLAAAGMVACRGGHPYPDRIALASDTRLEAPAFAMTAAPEAASPAAHATHAPCHLDESAEPSHSSAHAGPTEPDPQDSTHRCSACAACCLLAALPIDSQVPPVTPARAAPPLPQPSIAVSFLSEGPERPPRLAAS